MAMKISQPFQAMFARSVLLSALVAVPSVAAALPAVGPDAPVSLCGEEKADKGDSAQDDKRSEKKDAKKTDKKQGKDDKNDGKGAA
jgi:hypothetical protein